MLSNTRSWNCQSFPRSSSGCITCESLRIRCDEQKPACVTCVLTGRRCDGYSTLSRDWPQAAFAHGGPKAVTLSRHRPRSPLALNQLECRAFDFFRSRSAVKLSGFFDSSFWCRLLLQASHEEPIIQHAATALGALYESYQNSDPDQQKNGRADNPFALQQYNKAIGLLNRDPSLHGQRSIAVVLLACVLFIAFDSMRGDYEAAVTHLRSGLSVFRTWQVANSEMARPRRGSDQEGIESELTNMFMRINHTAVVFIDKRLCPTDVVTQDEKRLTYPMPEYFQSLGEARDWFHRLMCLIQINAFYKRQCREQLGSLEPEATHTYQELYFQWLDAYHTFVSSSNIGIGHKDFQGALLLDIQSRPMRIVCQTGMSPKETDFDAYQAEFESTVYLASALINDFQYHAVLGGTVDFSFERGLIFTLFFVAHRCRDPNIRRQALSLLAGLSRKEGIWSSKMFACIAERIILIEEGLKDIRDVKISKSHEVTIRVAIAEATILSDERKVLVKFLRTNTETGDESFQHELIMY